MSEQLIVSASGVRGVVGRGMTPEVAARYGAAFGDYLAGGSGTRPTGEVLVGRDSRTSGPLLAEAVRAGLASTGWDVADLGVVPTPTALLACQDDPSARGAVVITASHNPAEWNGLKLGTAEGLFISPEEGLAVQSRFDGAIASAPWNELGSSRKFEGAIRHHIERILALPVIDEDRVAKGGLRVALDAVGGAGGLILPELLERLGCEVFGIHLEPHGRFPRNPEPTADNLSELSALVSEHEADIGMAVDPDADRLALVDETGVPIGEDWTLALAAQLVLSKTPGPLVANLSSSRCILDVAEEWRAPAYRAPVGEANVALKMAEVGAVIGGEGNGGVMLPELHATRDAPLAAALLVQLLAETGNSLAESLRGRTRYSIAKRKAQRPELPLEALFERLVNQAPRGAQLDRQDGLRLEWQRRREWLHVRPSGTEPILRIVAEAADDAAAGELVDWATRVVTA